MSTYTLTSHGSRRRASASASEIPRSQTKRYHHSKQTSLSKIKPKMIYISTTPGISIMPSDFIFMGTPEPDLRETTSNNPFLTNTNTNVNTDTNTNTNPSPPDPPTSKNPTKPTVSITIKPLIDRFDTISSNSNSNASLNSTSRSHNSQRSSEKLKLQARTEEIFLEEGEKECFREGKQEKSSRRMERLLRGSGKESGRESVDLGVRDRSWFDASG
ncbi:predicted protein [Sclerotinia sclerotiorum 1980 UF-70]|nr:predicted protein [Sclerotinia sclerotiorum 1980 UF-70]EDN97030.1 predicted protein [Sclerotinia sclerotiorum 1980 UF-70]